MGQFNLPMQGKNVRISQAGQFVSTFSSSVNLNLYDADNNLVTLLPTERLIIDVLEGTCGAVNADIIASPPGTPASTVSSSTYLGPLINNSSFLMFNAKEGVPMPLGLVPSVATTFDGSTAVKVRGEGRIVEGTTEGVRPNWQEKQTPSGNF